MYGEWREIKDCSNYEVSENGEIRRSRQTHGSYKVGALLKININPRGYAYVRLANNGTVHSIAVHKLVAEAFINQKPTIKSGRLEVNHIDGDKSNNRISNLEYVSSKENKKHAIRTGLHKSVGGKKIRINMDIARHIRKLNNNGFNNTKIAKYFNVRPSLVSDVINNRCWVEG